MSAGDRASQVEGTVNPRADYVSSTSSDRDGSSQQGREGIDRRTFIRRGVLASGALLAGGAGLTELLASGESGDSPTPRVQWRAAHPSVATADVPPNILVVMVDQLRAPRWFPSGAAVDALLPNIARLRSDSVSFARHYTAANDCTPARAAFLTGLYPHQTGCLITGRSTLDPGFPTYGTLLRDQGYTTVWYGKWHLTRGDNNWRRRRAGQSLEPYGFDGGTFPTPDGAPGQGLRADPHIASQFEGWLAEQSPSQPWCATVSFVNPHDIAWWYRYTERKPAEHTAPSICRGLPANFQTPQQLIDSNKPSLQLSFLETAASAFGEVPYSGPDAHRTWMEFLDLYLQLQRTVDEQVGRVLTAVRSRPDLAANTVILFTSDHGEYGGSHGLRGKGAGAYEEAIRVPLFLHDPRGGLTREPGLERYQLTSSVDVVPLLLRIATGSEAWRREPHCAHLAKRADLAAIAAHPTARGRDWIAHVTDEVTTEFAPTLYARATPRHVIAMRTPRAKYATYSHWERHSDTISLAGQEHELYDYSTAHGALEMENLTGRSPIEEELRRTLQEEVIPHEVRRPLPGRLAEAQRRGLANYFEILPAQSRAPTLPRQEHEESHDRHAATD
jgi:arylsulfatase A-like enzyme